MDAVRCGRSAARSALLLAPLLALLLVARPVTAQLISPGPLSASHAELQSVRQCTACHRLGQRGVGADRCLSCHRVLAARIREQAGYHATVQDRTCGSCHAEHYGRDFGIIRFDTASFDHRAAGYPLKGAHAATRCGACHRAANVRSDELRQEKKTQALLERSFLGLSAACSGCHAADDPHGAQFGGRSCAECHAETRWTDAPVFDHQQARYALTGAHRAVECEACHAGREGRTQYRGVEHASCASCHTDPHRGAQGAACANCHTTAAWRAFGAGFDAARFNHDRTRFSLRGAHGRADCSACHRVPARNDAAIRIRLLRSDSRFAPIAVGDCRSCHVPAHGGARAIQVAGQDVGAGGGPGAGGNCGTCHDENAWAPAAFGSREHAATRFPLDGAHLLLDCRTCHSSPRRGRLDFARADISCNGCHAARNPHGRAFADAAGTTTCGRCHTPRSWQPRDVTHEVFPLSGRHAQVTCAACHAADRAGAPRQCEACHAAVDPHDGRSAGRTCEACHTSAGFSMIRFDHGTTRYPLDGAHLVVPCRACHAHVPEAGARLLLRYRPLPSRCEDCHVN